MVKSSPLMGEGLGGGERSTAVQLMSSDQRDLVLVLRTGNTPSPRFLGQFVGKGLIRRWRDCQQAMDALFGRRMVAKQCRHARQDDARIPVAQQCPLLVPHLDQRGSQTEGIAGQLSRLEIGLGLADPGY